MAATRVLVIDDEYGVRTGIQQILELEGCEVALAETGREGLERAEHQAFDVALIDYQLPDIDGLAVLAGVRSRPDPPMTCMVTAYANIEMAVAATRQGVDFFLPKPFTPEDLIGVVDTLCRHRRLREEAEHLRRANEASLMALATEKSQTRSLVASLAEAVLVVNREREVALANHAMAALLGSSPEALVRRPVQAVLSAEELAPLAALLTDAQAAGPGPREVHIGARSFAARCADYHADDGNVLGRILTLSEITELKRMAMEKQRFIRMMVHELRSPLGAMKSVLEVVLDRSLGPAMDAYDDMLRRADGRIDRLSELVGDLLTLARIDTSTQVGKSAPAESSVRAALDAVADLYRERATQRGLTFDLSAADGLVARIGGEELQMIVGNLVGNAIKYNRDGGTVIVRCTRDGAEVRLAVADTGLGISRDSLPQLFQEFFREKRAETRDIVGHGLGLAIVKRLLDQAGGRIEVASEANVGSTFTVWLPAAS